MAVNSENLSPKSTSMEVVVYLLAYVCFGAQINLLGPTLPLLAQHLHVAPTELTPLFTALGMGTIVGGIPSGMLVERVPGHMIVFFSLLVQCVGLFVLPLMPTLLTTTAVFFCICLSFCFLATTCFSMIMWKFPGKAAIWLNGLAVAFGIGSFLGPLLTRVAAMYLGSGLEVMRMLSVACAVTACLLLPFKSPCKPAPAAAAADAGAAAAPPSKTSGLRTGIFVLVLCGIFMSCCIEEIYGSWILTYCMESLDYAPSLATVVNSSFFLAFTAGRLLGLVLTAAVGPFICLMIMLPPAAVGAALPLLVPAAYSSSFSIIMAATVLLGMGSSCGFANSVGLMESFTRIAGSENGIIMATSGLGNMLGPIAVALLAPNTPMGYTVLFLLDAVLCVVLTGSTTCMQALGSALEAREATMTAETLALTGGDLLQPLVAQDREEAGSTVSSYLQVKPYFPAVRVHRKKLAAASDLERATSA